MHRRRGLNATAINPFSLVNAPHLHAPSCLSFSRRPKFPHRLAFGGQPSFIGRGEHGPWAGVLGKGKMGLEEGAAAARIPAPRIPAHPCAARPRRQVAADFHRHREEPGSVPAPFPLPSAPPPLFAFFPGEGVLRQRMGTRPAGLPPPGWRQREE